MKRDEIMDWRSELEKRLTALFHNTVAAGKPIRVIEAGGGSKTQLRTDLKLDITTIDISKEQLERNTYASKKICADIQDFNYTPRDFDVAIFWDVLEHLEDPKSAIERVSKAVDENGLIVIAGPDPYSMKGIITRFSPHIIHVLFYRYILKKKDAGMAGVAPFPTVLSGDAGPVSLKTILEREKFSIVYKETSVSNQVRKIKEKYYPIYLFYIITSIILRAISSNKYGVWETDFILIAQRI